MTDKVQCRKCGEDLDPKQKVCPKCGERTAAGFKFDVEEEKHWRPSPTLVKIVVTAAVVLVTSSVLYNMLHVVPPENVANEWFSAMSSRSIGTSRELTTRGFEARLESKMSNLVALSDEYNLETYTNRATFRVGKPVYQDPSHAQVTVFLTYPGNTPGPEVKVQLVKRGRKWMVDGAI